MDGRTYLLIRIRHLAHALLHHVAHLVLAHGLEGLLFDLALQPGRDAEEEDVAAHQGDGEDEADEDLRGRGGWLVDGGWFEGEEVVSSNGKGGEGARTMVEAEAMVALFDMSCGVVWCVEEDMVVR